MPPVFSGRECWCGFVVTAAGSVAAQTAMDEHFLYTGHRDLRAAWSGPAEDRLTFRSRRVT